MQELVHNTKSIETPTGIGSMGSFNKMPEPYKEIDETQFWAEFVFYSPTHIEHRQVCDFLDNKTMRNTRIYWWKDKGVAVLLPQDQRKGVFQDKPQYFLLGCTHEWREVGYQEAQDRGLHHDGYQFHLSECVHCGTKQGGHSDD
jgi:hypothetical protein